MLWNKTQWSITTEQIQLSDAETISIFSEWMNEWMKSYLSAKQVEIEI